MYDLLFQDATNAEVQKTLTYIYLGKSHKP